MSQKKFDPFRRFEETPARLYVIFAILAIAAHIIVCMATELSPAVVGIILIGVYLISALTVYFISRRRGELLKLESDACDEQNNGVVYAFRNHINAPYAVVTESGKVITVNNAMRQAAGLWDTVFNSEVSAICGLSMNEIIFQATESEEDEDESDGEYEIQVEKTAGKECIVTIREKLYQIRCYPMRSSHRPYYILTFTDVTKYRQLSDLHYRELTAVGYIVLDNMEDIAQYVKESFEAEALQVDRVLRDWAIAKNAVIREYSKNKYIVFMNREMLEECIANKFEIINKISDVRIGEGGMPIMASIGIATTGKTLTQRERDALVALDLALQRGGGQAVVKTEDGNEFYGGRTKSQQKRTGKQSRIIASHLASTISNSSNVIVMGHSNPDFDSIGACIGIAALCMYLGVEVKIVIDTENDNFKACTAKLKQYSDYKNIFVNGVEGLEACTFSTLLIVVDANNFSILEAPEIAEHSFKTAIIDHHIKKQEFEEAPVLQYIDPSASSASELVSEILEFSLPAGRLRKEEANVIMSGIMVDTNNFTRTVGTRTFAAALYLRGAGASTEYARTFFEENFEDYQSESRFGSEAKIYRDNIAITAVEGTGAAGDRVAAAKAADKLLSVRNVSAAFALIRIGSTVFISARSDGSVNVQLILEKIGGGGHFDVAGGAIADCTLEDAEAILTDTIDDYFENSKQKS